MIFRRLRLIAGATVDQRRKLERLRFPTRRAFPSRGCLFRAECFRFFTREPQPQFCTDASAGPPLLQQSPCILQSVRSTCLVTPFELSLSADAFACVD